MKTTAANLLVLFGVIGSLLLAPKCFGSEIGKIKTQVAPTKNTVSVDRIITTPDLMQTLPAANLPYDGTAYCGPVAVSNSLVWLTHQGYPKLGLNDGADSPFTQGKLARVLGDKMSTGSGTFAFELLRGIDQFVVEQGYAVDYLKYQGYEFRDPKYDTGVKIPDLNWIKSGLKGPSGVWLSIGFYNYSPDKDEYVPFSEHWVTLVGFGQDKNGKEDPNILIIHDPAERSGAATSHDYVRLEKLQHGTFAAESPKPDKQAKGWYKMGGDLKIKKGSNCAILEGAVVLRMKKAN